VSHYNGTRTEIEEVVLDDACAVQFAGEAARRADIRGRLRRMRRHVSFITVTCCTYMNISMSAVACWPAYSNEHSQNELTIN